MIIERVNHDGGKKDKKEIKKEQPQNRVSAYSKSI